LPDILYALARVLQKASTLGIYGVPGCINDLSKANLKKRFNSRVVINSISLLPLRFLPAKLLLKQHYHQRTKSLEENPKAKILWKNDFRNREAPVSQPKAHAT